MTKNRLTRIRATITIGALIILGAYLVRPFTIDPVILVLLCIAVLPWLTSILKSVELPFGIKIEFQELKEVEEKAKKVGLVTHTVDAILRKPAYSFQTVADEDPILALAGLRIELEKRLFDLLRERGFPPPERGIATAIRRLVDYQVLSQEQSSVLLDLVGILNKAVHGARVDERASRWALDVGVSLLRSLEKKK